MRVAMSAPLESGFRMQRRDIYKASKALSIPAEIDANLIATEQNEVFFRICFVLVLPLVKINGALSKEIKNPRLSRCLLA
jgi:hypothetical protein